ncbi:hypothetical protein C8E83_1065 [Frondihabitans australicus]|uniref:Uncharacterized protein n=1 Tax=Frondihabitans australicus TaxID=386892 RepID=A0A495IFJ4_9MICO|nr:hypothetical protein C8E83_1065 [Frondihabitans australicus]
MSAACHPSGGRSHWGCRGRTGEPYRRSMISPRLAIAATVLTVAIAVPSVIAASVSAAPAPHTHSHTVTKH